jgi:hypothetical protein
MFIATGSAFDFVKFIQILCWILVPVFLLVASLTIFFHYRRKRIEKAELAAGDDVYIHSSPELLGYTKGDGEYIFFDHSSLISEYKKRLSYNHARYTALHHDFEKLETKYAMLAQYTGSMITNKKSTSMENSQEQIPQHVEKEINKMTTGYIAEKKELLARLDQLGTSYQSLEQEHQSLLEKVSLETVTDEERTAIIDRWREENILLKDKVAEHEYLKDVVEEKKMQISFLQTQLEQRIKIGAQSENQRNQLVADLELSGNVNENTLQQLELLKAELAQQKAENSKLQVLLNEKEELLSERQQLLASKMDHITWLENTLHELKEKNELLNTNLSYGKDRVSVLQEQVSDEQIRANAIEQKLAANKQGLQRLHKELSALADEGDEQSPVIPLRPEYVSPGNEEVAAQ